MTDFAQRRTTMVEDQLVQRGIADKAVLEAMGIIPREAFVDDDVRELAYRDGPLPIGAEQTISQPYIVARMIEAAEVKSCDNVLEVGAGSGYAAAVTGSIARKVHAIERHRVLADLAARRMESLGYSNVAVLHGDGMEGLSESAPFDAILVAARGADVPQALFNQLAPGGRLVIPIGGADMQMLKRYRKREDGGIDEDELGMVRFVPLLAGKKGD